MSGAAAQQTLRATVVYARPERQWVIEIALPEGATLADALRESGLLASCPELAATPPVLGLAHRRLAAHTPLRNGDRVEVYRPLQIDPKEARRLRARGGQSSKSNKSGEGSK